MTYCCIVIGHELPLWLWLPSLVDGPGSSFNPSSFPCMLFLWNGAGWSLVRRECEVYQSDTIHVDGLCFHGDPTRFGTCPFDNFRTCNGSFPSTTAKCIQMLQQRVAISAKCIQMLQQRVAISRAANSKRYCHCGRNYSAVLHPGNEAKIRAHALPDRIALGTQVVVVVPVDLCSRIILWLYNLHIL